MDEQSEADAPTQVIAVADAEAARAATDAPRGRLGRFGYRRGSTRPRRRAHQAIAALLVLLVLLGFVCAAGVPRALDAAAAARDAKAQLTALRGELSTRSLVSVPKLTSTQHHLQALQSDLNRLQADVIFPDALAALPVTGSGMRVLRMGSSFVAAGLSAVNAALVILPHIKSMVKSADDTPSTVKGVDSKDAGPLTLAQLNQATQDITLAITQFHQGMSARAAVSDNDLRQIGLGRYVPLLHQLDALTADTSTYLDEAQVVLKQLPALLGYTHPARYLFFDQDSDELRPTGGFQGNYALITFVKGQLQGGFHLHDIYLADCAIGCNTREVPAQFAWFQLDPHHFGLRDANLDPDYPASARIDEQMYQLEDHTPVDGVISITPSFIEQILEITGPLHINLFNTNVSAANLRDQIHYAHFHSLVYDNSYNLGPSYDVGRYLGTSDRKVMDVLLASTLLHTLVGLPLAKDTEVARLLPRALATHDLQMYLNNTQVEGILRNLKVDGSLATPPGDDSLAVVDANVGGTYANADVQERVTDSVTLDTNGTATHALTITYEYPYVTHSYDKLYDILVGPWVYDDFVRVIVPSGAHLLSMDGCTPASTTEAGHAVWACSFALSRSNQRVLHFRWSVPPQHAIATGHPATYTLLLQREAGNLQYDTILLTAPSGTRFSLPAHSPLLLTPTGAGYQADLSENLPLTVSYPAGKS